MRYAVVFDSSPSDLKEFDYNVVDTDGFDITIAWCAIRSDADRIAKALNACESS